MKYDHKVNRNGVYYATGQEVPENDMAMDDEPLPFSDVENIDEEPDSRYTRSEIMTMRTADLRDVAEKNGVDNAHDLPGTELKKILIEKFGL